MDIKVRLLDKPSPGDPWRYHLVLERGTQQLWLECFADQDKAAERARLVRAFFTEGKQP